MLKIKLNPKSNSNRNSTLDPNLNLQRLSTLNPKLTAKLTSKSILKRGLPADSRIEDVQPSRSEADVGVYSYPDPDPDPDPEANANADLNSDFHSNSNSNSESESESESVTEGGIKNGRIEKVSRQRNWMRRDGWETRGTTNSK
jgi:hypothetical protein